MSIKAAVAVCTAFAVAHYPGLVVHPHIKVAMGSTVFVATTSLTIKMWTPKYVDHGLPVSHASLFVKQMATVLGKFVMLKLAASKIQHGNNNK